MSISIYIFLPIIGGILGGVIGGSINKNNQLKKDK